MFLEVMLPIAGLHQKIFFVGTLLTVVDPKTTLEGLPKYKIGHVWGIWILLSSFSLMYSEIKETY